jgi:tetratricopeptide (TPR) repeat protein
MQGFLRRTIFHVIAVFALCGICVPAIAAANESTDSSAVEDPSAAQDPSVVALVETKNVIARIDTKDTREGSQIRIVFAEPLLYVGHQPLKSSNRLTIRLRPLASPATFASRYQGKQSLRQTPTPLIPLTNVLYINETGARARVILEFNRDVLYRVKSNRQGDSITITLPSIAIKGTPPPPLPTAPGDVNLEGHYVINLESSDRPVPIWTIPSHELFERYTLYTRKVRIDDKEWERLRLGFFPDKSTARAVVEELKDIYPGAWIAVVPRKEKVLSVRTIVKPTGPPGDTARPVAKIEIEEDTRRWYALELESRSTPYDTLPEFEQFEPLQSYVADTRRGTTKLHSLRLGFFPSVPDARDVAKLLQEKYPQLQIVLVTDLERKVALQPGVSVVHKAERVEAAAPAPPTKVEKAAPATSSKADKIYQLSRQALTAGEYRRAIGLLTSLLQTDSDQYRQEAQELLGFARERNGQIAHAKAEYETYLRLYPDSEGSERVRQRLAGLVTAARTPATASSESQSDAQRAPWHVYGNLSQFYWRDTNYTDEDEEIVNVSELSSYVLLGGRRRTDSFDFRTQFAVTDRRDFLEDDDDTRVLDAYIDFTDRRYDYYARGGRQTLRSGGVLGRFDGVFAGYHLNDYWAANVVAGVPVDSFDTGLDVDKQFYGINADLVFSDYLDFNAFYIEQTADGLVDRQAIGGDAHYLQSTKSLVGLIDYDIHYDKTNIVFLSGTWSLASKTSLYSSIDYRNSPLLTTSNALQGQSVTSLDALQDSFTTAEIESMALDRTATSETLSIGASHRLSKTLEGNLDATFADLGETEASAGVAATPSSKGGYYSLQMTKNDLVSPMDVSILTLRYADTDVDGTASILASYRMPLNGWRINPLGRLDFRKNKDDDNYRNTLAMIMRADYRARRNLRLDMELGVELSDQEVADLNQDSNRYYVNVGYYWDF